MAVCFGRLPFLLSGGQEMEQEEIIQKLSKIPTQILGEEDCCRYAVAVLLVQKDPEVRLLFEKRSARLSTQPGDICFPGGRIEDGENGAAALRRELQEELCLSESEADNFHILGRLPLYHKERMIIEPYVVETHELPCHFNPEEVEELFTVPLSFFTGQGPACYTIRCHVCLPEDFPTDRIVGGAAYQWRPRREQIYFYQWQDRCIWGITAAIIREFVHFLLAT